MSVILKEVYKKKPHRNTKYHCLFSHFYGGIRKSGLAKLYGKSKTSVGSWIRKFNEFGFLPDNKRENVIRKFTSIERRWIINMFEKNPMIYFDEVKKRFQRKFTKSISKSSIGRILHINGYTRKVLERRAIQIKDSKILDFAAKLNSFGWDLSSLCFLDEISVDNRGIWRNRGWSKRGKPLIRRCEFRRGSRNSLLCFLGQQGLQEAFDTDGTFTRKKFFRFCKRFAFSGKVQRYPGRNSIWILDNAKIHCHTSIAKYLKSIGIVPIFLPPYTPFYNPIEILFGILKKRLKKIHRENGNLFNEITEILTEMTNFRATNLMKKCGYLPGGRFDPTKNYGQ
jgi:transposase